MSTKIEKQCQHGLEMMEQLIQHRYKVIEQIEAVAESANPCFLLRNCENDYRQMDYPKIDQK